jgi:hypothetical protein
VCACALEPLLGPAAATGHADALLAVGACDRGGHGVGGGFLWAVALRDGAGALGKGAACADSVAQQSMRASDAP